MIHYTVYEYFSNNKKKWINSILALFLFGIVLRYIVYEDFLPAGENLTLYDYFFSSLSYPFIIILILPLLFCYLTSDIILSDFSDNYINFLTTRVANRASYFFSKVITMFVASNVFVISYMSILIILAFIFRLPLTGECYYSPIMLFEHTNKSIFLLLFIQYALILIFLITLGFLFIAISLFFRKSIYNFIIVIILITESHNSVFNDNSTIMFSPLSQGIFSLHYPFNMATTLTNYTIIYSIRYLLFISIILFIISYFRIRSMNLYIKD